MQLRSTTLLFRLPLKTTRPNLLLSSAPSPATSLPKTHHPAADYKSPPMTTFTSPTSTRTTMDMQLVEYTFARWVYIDKCDDFVDALGNPTPDMRVVVDTLGSDTACVRALILHGHLASGRQRRLSQTPLRDRANGSRRLTPLEAFKEALRIGLAAAEDPTAAVVDITTRPWVRTSRPIYWFPVSPAPDLPAFNPRPLSALTWTTVNSSGTTTASGTDLICAPRELSSQVNPSGSVEGDLSGMWSCNEAQVVYRNGECTVYPRQPGMKPFVVTGLPAAQPRVLKYCESDYEAGTLHTTARPASSQDVTDTPMLLIWSCVHGDLFVQAPNQVPVLPPISSFDFVRSSSTCAFNPQSSSTSLEPPPLVSSSHDPGSSLPAVHSSPTPAPRPQPTFPSGRPHPRQRQQSNLPSAAPYLVPAAVPPASQRPTQSVKAQGTAQSKDASLTVRPAGRATQVLPGPQSAPRPAPPSLSVFQSRATGTSKGVPSSLLPQTPVSQKRVRHDHGQPTPSYSSSPISGPPSSPPASPSDHRDPGPTSSTTAPSEPAPPVSSDKTPCGLDSCAALLTPRSWEKHYDAVHDISEETWVVDSLCSHPACREAQATAMANGAPHSKLTIGLWATYKRHVRQVHFPDGRTHPCTFPGCKAVLSRSDALLRHVESKHKVAHAGRERPNKRPNTDRVADHEEGPAKKKKAQTINSPTKQNTPRMKASGTKTPGEGEKASLTPTLPSSQKGKGTAREGNTRENRCPRSASASYAASPSGIKVYRTCTTAAPLRAMHACGDEDVDMVDDEDEEMSQSEDEYDDEWPQGDIIEDEMNLDPDNHY